jgi:hypothetical protein
MEKMNNFEEFDTRVDRYLRHQMTAEEEQAFRSEIASDSEKKERARITALMIKAMQQEGLSQDNKIIEEICTGCDENVLVEPDRVKAIEMALTMSSKNDIIILIGKGNEPSLFSEGKMIPCTDHDVVQRYLKEPTAFRRFLLRRMLHYPQSLPQTVCLVSRRRARKLLLPRRTFLSK